MDVVDETLREWRAGTFVYGQSDCMLSIGRYLALTGHADVTGRFVGRYDTHEGAQAMMEAHGGVPGLMALAGALAKDGTPARGDVIEVSYQRGGRDCGIGALCTGDSVALRLERGMIELRMGLIQCRGVWHGSR
ncbi:DUF6950 family protein [Sphingopyxis indica]|uniref:DUF6950 domain-containing protein n=1 Tax=Sphingopyxis indica TaxID=436663 RepID=A0A239KNS8_9SPHN|nr:hypothetical protein [Sphingopyxis indica]SNT19382.1 hypothetical protein SAMN06295955_11551 [Sphingopyxis indica]